MPHSGICAPYTDNFNLRGSKEPISEEGQLLPAATARVPFNLKLWLSPSYFGFFMLRDQWARIEAIIMLETLDPDHQEEAGLLSDDRSRREHTQHARDTRRCHWVTPCRPYIENDPLGTAVTAREGPGGQGLRAFEGESGHPSKEA